MSVSEGHTLAALMPIATIPKGRTAVHVNLDSLAVEENARVSITLRMLSKAGRFSNLILSDKTKTTFTISRTVRKGDLKIYCCFYSCWCFYIYIYIYYFFFLTIICF